MAASLLEYFCVAAPILSLVRCEMAGMHHCKQSEIPDKKIDTAYLTVDKQGVNSTVIVQLITAECYKCDLKNVTFLTPEEDNCTVRVDTRWTMRVQLVSDNTGAPLVDCGESHLSQHFKDQGRYRVTIRDSLTCTKISPLNSPEDSNIPIYVAIAACILASLLWIAGKKLHRSHALLIIRQKFTTGSTNFIDPASQERMPSPTKPDGYTPIRSSYNLRQRKGRKTISSKQALETSYTEQDLGNPNLVNEGGVERRPRRERLKSLDTVRGISIILMIFVNYRGGDYWFFRHSKWNGLTVADLVFPWFVWIMGTAMVYSFQSLLRNATSKKRIFWKIFKRSCILFLLGLLINCDGIAAPKMKEFRIPGVLQRFAGTYLIIATMHMFFARPTDSNQYKWWSDVRDIVDYWGEWVINIIIVIIYLTLTFLLPVPGCPTGYLGPGGLAEGGKYYNCTGGAAGYIDRTIFGAAHIYQTPTCKEIYETTVPHDPEGLLGTLMSCFICFLGLQAGKILVTFPDWKARVKRFIIWALILGVLALALCNAKKNDGWIPINKNLWSFSFVLAMGSMGFILLAFCYVTIDVYKIWTGAPFYYPGMNAIVLYMGHECIKQPIRTFIGLQPNSHATWLGVNVGDTALWILLSYYLFHRKIFISI